MGGRIRPYLRLAVAALLYYPGLLSLLVFLRQSILGRKEVCVFCLHRVLSPAEGEKTQSLPGMVIREDTFAHFLEYLRRRFDVISLHTFLESGACAHKSGKPACLLTFDDGWGDNYVRAFPQLKSRSMPAVVFLATSFVAEAKGFWVEDLIRIWRDPGAQPDFRNRLREAGTSKPGPEAGLEEIIEWLKHMPSLERERILAMAPPARPSAPAETSVDRPLTWAEIQEMRQNGIVFGSHTLTHPLLPYEPDDVVERELTMAKEILEQHLNEKVLAFAYPNGAWDERVRDMVSRAGYACAFTTRRGWSRRGDDPYTIRRITLHEGTMTGPGGRFSPALISFRLFLS